MYSTDKLPNAPKKWDTPNGHSPMANLANQFHPITDDTVKFIDEHTFKVSILKGKYLLRPGDICEHIYFIQKGAIRAFIKEGNKDITTWITTENEMATSIRGFETQEPCLENIQAIEDCELVAANYKDLQHLYKTSLEMNIVARKLYEFYYRAAEERAYISRLSKASSKYLHFVSTRGDLLNRIPLKYIASYLGMTIETLSRIRGKLVKKK